MSEWILEVHDDVERTAVTWASAVKEVLRDQKASLGKANEYRNYFAAHFTWEATAQQFLERISQLSNENC
jgi:hypothetical protein